MFQFPMFSSLSFVCFRMYGIQYSSLSLSDLFILLVLAYRSVKRHFSLTCFITPLKTLSFSFSLRIIGLEPTKSAWKADVITISPNSLDFFLFLFFFSICLFFSLSHLTTCAHVSFSFPFTRYIPTSIQFSHIPFVATPLASLPLPVSPSVHFSDSTRQSHSTQIATISLLFVVFLSSPSLLPRLQSLLVSMSILVVPSLLRPLPHSLLFLPHTLLASPGYIVPLALHYCLPLFFYFVVVPFSYSLFFGFFFTFFPTLRRI